MEKTKANPPPHAPKPQAIRYLEFCTYYFSEQSNKITFSLKIKKKIIIKKVAGSIQCQCINKN